MVISRFDNLRIIVAGSRDFDDYDLLEHTISEYLTNRHKMSMNYMHVEIVSGTARGADKLGEKFAKLMDFDLKRFPADWFKYGKRAGYLRNEEMAKYASKEIGVLIAFWDGESNGTKHMIDIAKRYGLEVHVVNYKED